MRKDTYKPERFMAFIDAVLAIVVTVLVLELPMPEHATLEALWDLRINFIAYAISFIQIFGIWRGFFIDFQNIKVVNMRSIYSVGFYLFTISLIPFATEFVAEHYQSRVAEYFFLFIFFLLMVTGYWFYYEVERANKAYDDKNKTIQDDLEPDIRDLIGLIMQFSSWIIIYFFPPYGLISMSISVISYSLPENKFLGTHLNDILKKGKPSVNNDRI